MGSVAAPQVGDWLEHEAIRPASSRLLGRRPAKRAEVIDVTSQAVSLYLEGEPGIQTVTPAEVTRWWNLWTPPQDQEDIVPPGWLVDGTECTVGNFRAVIRVVRLNWISYVEQGAYFCGVFRLVPYSEFDRAGWVKTVKVSAWEWLRNPIV
jgi:hypothetical protein